MQWDRFDICEAWYLALSHCHKGQWSRSYEKLVQLTGYFSPRHSLSVDTLSENAREIYNAACSRLLA